MATVVVGRDRELDALAAFLDAAGARVLVLEGEPGIGKTSLWRHGIDAARATGQRVLTSAPAGAEAELAFTALRDVMGDAFDEIADELPLPQRRALAVALLRESPGDEPLEPATVAVASLTALRALGARTAVLVAVDDVQWLDPASAAVLQYALRRLETEPVRLLLTRRPDETGPLQLDRVDGVQVLELRGVTVGALARIVHEQLGKTFTRPTLHRLHEVSRGNALYALEVARSLGDAAPGAALPVPRPLRQLVEERLAALPAQALEVLLLIAALSRPTLQLLAAALHGDPGPSLESALEAHVIEVDGDVVRFAHPLFGAAVYGLAPLQRTAVHERLAGVVSDPEERARHLALATQVPDEEVARRVEEGATVAFSRGSPAAAAELAAHAVRLTPPEEGAGKRRALAEADYLFAAGDTSAASALLAQLVAAAPAGPERAQVLSRQARLHHFGQDISGSVGLLHRALAESGGDATLRGEIEEGLAWGLLLSREDLGGAAEHARSAAALAETRGDDAALAEALAVQALTEFVRGRPWEATMERALSLESATRHLRVLRHPSFAYGYCLSCSDDLDRARDVFEELLRRAAEAGDDGSVPSILNHLTLIECHAGRWARASVHADECYERALESRQLPTQASILGKKALLAAGRGDADVARALARDALPADFDPARPEDAMARGGETAVAAIGFLELSVGSAAEAERYLGPMTRSLLDAGVAEPGEVRSLADEIEALVALRRHSEAEELLTRLEAWASRLQRPSVLGIAARCRGVLEESVEKLEEAATYAALPFERGRTLLALGTQQRRLRQRRAARETLGRALAIFEELGAALMTHHTREELGRIGGRAPSSGELTATERRVAELVAAGRQNKEVAAELVVSVHTVEATLTRIYQKLDVRSRTELAARLNKD